MTDPLMPGLRSRGPVPKDWTVLRSDDGYSLVVPPGTTPAEALAELLIAQYGGDWSADHPGVIEAAQGQRVEVFHSCSKAWKEGEGVDWDEDWWAPHGDGRRWVHAFSYDGSLYDLGDKLSASESDDNG